MLDAKEIKSEGKDKLPKKKDNLDKDEAKDLVADKAKNNLLSLKGQVQPANDNAIDDKPEKKVLTPQQKEIIERLNAAKNCQTRVEIFATIADDIGLDPLISLIPELGDAGSSIVSGTYLLYEAKKANLGVGSYLKIVALQAADFAIGAIPILGDAADYFFKANKWSAKDFEKQTKKLVEEARKAGVPEEDITKITTTASKLPQLVNHGVALYKGAKGTKGMSESPSVSPGKMAA